MKSFEVDKKNLHEIRERQCTLQYQLDSSTSEGVKKEELEKYISVCIADGKVIVPEFESDLQWVNTTRPLQLHTDLRRRIVILDFFTYCCINCMHILPPLKLLEEKFAQKGVVVVGVHSAKFDNEKNMDNVVSAVLRYDISHPVVNDWRNTMWNSLDIMCWPSFVVLGPNAEVLLQIVGEHEMDRLAVFVESAIEYFGCLGLLNAADDLPLKPLKSTLPCRPLLFPGKIACCLGVTDTLAIADSGHHRVLISSPSGLVRTIIGGEDPGFEDGDFHKAKFHSPQGVAWMTPSVLFVADTENHAIRKLDLSARQVSTVAGTGERRTSDVSDGLDLAIASPWDLCVINWSRGGDTDQRMLLIAMAGTHQIWGYAIDHVTAPKGRFVAAGDCVRLVGTGDEENRNNQYSHLVSFAQPSGVCLARSQVDDERALIVADSESSSIRSVNLTSWATEGIVGGSKNPKDLFVFGDDDGTGVDAKLQHPLGVCYSAQKDAIYVADSYNHKLKRVHLESKWCETLKLNGDGPHFSEPGGVCLSSDESLLFVADTNNHCIKLVDLHNATVEQVPVRFTDGVTVSASSGDSDVTDHVIQRNARVSVEASKLCGLKLFLCVHETEDVKLNKEAPNRWQLFLPSDSDLQMDRSCGTIEAGGNRLELCTLSVPTVVPSQPLELLLTLILCVSGLCCPRRVLVKIPVDNSATELSQLSEQTVEYNLAI